MKPLKEIVLEELSGVLDDVAPTMIKDVPQGIGGDFSLPTPLLLVILPSRMPSITSLASFSIA